MEDFFLDYKNVFVAIHLLGVALGLGGATITDYSFFRALKDKKFSEDELHLLAGLTRVIWVGIIVLVLSGFALFYPNAGELLQSAKFIGKMCAVAIVIINGFLLGAVITPRLKKFDYSFRTMNEVAFHRLSYSLGAVSASSWYSAFILAFLPKDLPIPTWSLALLYGGILIAALLGGQVMYKAANVAFSSAILFFCCH